MIGRIWEMNGPNLGEIPVIYGTIYPRIMNFVPTITILEIAPGYGRCTQYLKSLCQKLIVVDLTKSCIDFCKEKFKDLNNIEYHVNDGLSLNMLQDNSIDFVFSWDSLVHAEAEVIESYLKYLAAKMKPGGYGFIHHSNFGASKNPQNGAFPVNMHWRAETMTAELFQVFCRKAGLLCLSQEIINWREDILNDCFSVFKKRGLKDPASFLTRVQINSDFSREMSNLKRISEMYQS